MTIAPNDPARPGNDRALSWWDFRCRHRAAQRIGRSSLHRRTNGSCDAGDAQTRRNTRSATKTVTGMLASDALATEVRADEAQAREYGISGVPFFLIPGAGGVSGAQPPDSLLLMLQRAWDKIGA